MQQDTEQACSFMLQNQLFDACQGRFLQYNWYYDLAEDSFTKIMEMKTFYTKWNVNGETKWRKLQTFEEKNKQAL
jgi:hypothetical protein